MGKWSPAVQGKDLCGLLANGLANPNFTKPHGIDPAKGLKPEFEEVAEKRFREKYKNTAKDCVLSVGTESQQKKATSLPKLVRPAGKSRFQAFCTVIICVF